MAELDIPAKREVGRYTNNRVENSHLPFRRRERAMLRFRQMKSLQNSPPFTPTCTATSVSNVTSSIPEAPSFLPYINNLFGY